MSLHQESLQNAIHDYLVNYSNEANLAPKTVQNKKDILKRLLPYLQDRPFTFETCREFIAYMFGHGWNTPNTRLNLVRVMRAFVNFLYKHKYIEENFAQDLAKPKVPRKEFDYVDPETVENIIIAGTEPSHYDNERNRKIKIEMRACLRFILRTGLRINEAITLKGSDLNLFDNPPTFWVISKGGNREILPLPKDMIEELKTRLERDRVFEVTEKTCNEVLQRGAKALGMPVKLTNHSLRHIFASSLVKNGVPIQMVSRLLRHSSVEITDKTYTHLNVVDLSLILNGKQSIVLNGLSPEQVLENFQKILNDYFKYDSRISVNIEKKLEQKELLIKFEY
ncbi:MAG TPA: tyrosine-type recombinase/integrase [Patescibacteria group bacterium]|nr:tyrosine-type recombinase/integrase [Patescibacteria group bacterium]